METINEPIPTSETMPDGADVYAFPATPQQQQLWFLDSLYLGNPAYNIPLAYEVHGTLNPEALDQSFNWVVNRHENLRTTFALRGDEFQQVVEPRLSVRLNPLNLAEFSGAEREEKCRFAIANEARHRFDLTHGPLVRGTLIHLESGRHVLMFNFHHIILDHLSVLQFAREFCHAYAAFLKGIPPGMGSPEFQYPDFTIWQNQQFEESSFQSDLNDWVKELAGASPETPLPFDRPRTGAQTFAGREVKFSLSPALSGQIREFSRAAKKSVYVTLLTTFNCLLARYSGQNDIIVGSPFSNRIVSNLEGVMGCCMNTLPLRSRLESATTFTDALGIVHQTVLAAHQKQRVPLKLIVDHAKLERDASRNPLFQSTFTVQDPPMSITLEGVRTVPLAVHNDTSKFDMAVWIWEAGGQFSGVWEYNSDLFDSATIERMIRNFETLAESAVGRPIDAWRRLPLLSQSEYALVTEGFNRTETSIPAGITVVDLVEQAAAASPRGIALVQETQTVSYADLLQRSNAVAGALAAAGVETGALVGIYTERTTDMVVSMLGILKSGAAYLPLDPAFPADRLTFMIEDSGLAVILTQTSLVENMPKHRARVVLVDGIQSEGTGASSVPARSNPSGLAYVRYTSGSTGRPKGVEIGHRALLNFLLAMRREPGFGRQDRLLAVTTLSFDISELEIWLPLICGGQVVIASRSQAADGAALKTLLKRNAITVMQATPATWRLLLEAGWPGDSRLTVLCGGEALPVDLAARLEGKCAALWNMYGPTETTIWSSAWRVQKGSPIRVGPPIANTSFYIVDAAFQAVPLGAQGELLIGGLGLANGYRQRPDLTNDRFVSNPFHPSERVYRTGDLARFREDGTLEFLGRIDNQVKLRGYRIELGEIEAVFAEVAAVRDVIVHVRDEQLVAYYVGDSSQAIDIADCRTSMATRLPEYMVPTSFVRLEHMPLTANGKVDRKALPAPTADSSTVSRQFIAARTDTEKRLVQIWEKILKRAPIGVLDNFFHLGGHSLTAVTLFERIENEFGRRLPLASLFQNPNIVGLSALLSTETAPSQEWRSLVAIREGGSRPGVFLIHGAGGNILIYRSLAHRLAPGFPVYGLQSLGLDGVIRPLATIEEMSRSYADEIKRKQPEGPYIIIGYCMGGKIAFEVARILAAENREIELVGLLDSYNVGSAARVGRVAFYRQMIGFHLRNILELQPADASQYLKEKLRMLLEAIAATASATLTKTRHQFFGRRGNARIDFFIQKINDRAGEIYVPKPYDGRVTLFKPHRNYVSFSDAHMGWRDVVRGEIEVVPLELNPHAMLVEPYVRKLADAINSRLDRSVNN